MSLTEDNKHATVATETQETDFKIAIIDVFKDL